MMTDQGGGEEEAAAEAGRALRDLDIDEMNTILH
jgi:hypothetical protein